MIQGGDPNGDNPSQLPPPAPARTETTSVAGTGKGGECIWGGKFEDEFSDRLKVFCPLFVFWWASGSLSSLLAHTGGQLFCDQLNLACSFLLAAFRAGCAGDGE